MDHIISNKPIFQHFLRIITNEEILQESLVPNYNHFAYFSSIFLISLPPFRLYFRNCTFFEPPRWFGSGKMCVQGVGTNRPPGFGSRSVVGSSDGQGFYEILLVKSGNKITLFVCVEYPVFYSLYHHLYHYLFKSYPIQSYQERKKVPKVFTLVFNPFQICIPDQIRIHTARCVEKATFNFVKNK